MHGFPKNNKIKINQNPLKSPKFSNSSGLDVVAIIDKLGLSERLGSKTATNASTFVLAYAFHKLFAPARIGITLSVTPFLVRYLRAKGILKAPKL
jgi:hypothetical protein